MVMPASHGMKAAAVLLAALYLLHQDVWFCRGARPLVFGVLPIGLFYHAVFTVAISVVLWVVIRLIWPSQLDPGAASRR
jgi:hypothetical protein